MILLYTRIYGIHLILYRLLSVSTSFGQMTFTTTDNSLIRITFVNFMSSFSTDLTKYYCTCCSDCIGMMQSYCTAGAICTAEQQALIALFKEYLLYDPDFYNIKCCLSLSFFPMIFYIFQLYGPIYRRLDIYLVELLLAHSSNLSPDIPFYRKYDSYFSLEDCY